MAGGENKQRDNGVASTATTVANSSNATNNASRSPSTTEHNTSESITTEMNMDVRAPNHRRRRLSDADADAECYSVPDEYQNLDEVAAPCPVENVTDGPIYRHSSLELARSHEQEWRRDRKRYPNRHPKTRLGGTMCPNSPPKYSHYHIWYSSQ
ncbi:hypothetical protein VFPPC_18198 [Pochonia chlamydosporia 170]|uniref:Uncharacterized protein n=1 Tax=Pochonia chlamydosporia 170 TaxID=1380566 RepID=A0A219AP82_METCM|nr:hypothetical protein VFPPC_18198 [Pochonia chlamydosporia 170]OWT42638.1 hypothetical protein VFPPC_18198 [Pochonia chlamydosporia 170]